MLATLTPGPGRAPTSTIRGLRALGALLAVVAVVLAAGCGTVRAFTDLEEELRGGGFRNVSVRFTGTNPVVLLVAARSPVGTTTEAGHEEAARLVWTRFTRQVDRVRITVDGERRDLTRAQLQERFGPRAAHLDEGGELTDDITRLGLWIIVGALVGGLVVAGLTAVVVIVLVRRGRRRRAAVPPPHPGTPFGPAGPAGSGGPAGPHPGAWAPPAAPTWPPAGLPPGAGPPTDPGPVAPPPGTVVPGPLAAPRPGPARDGLGRRPRGPVPPPSQLPPGWGS